METKLKELQKAKENTIWLVENSDGQVDFHSLSYWAGEVERLRSELRKEL